MNMPTPRLIVPKGQNRPAHSFSFNTHSAFVGCLFLSGFLFTILPDTVNAEQAATDEWNISADKVTHFENPKSIVAQGNVVLIKKEKLPLHPVKKITDVTEWSELLGETPDSREISAEEAEKQTDPVYKTTVTIRADWIVYDTELESIKAKGNLRIISDDDKLFAEEGTLNLITETGRFKEATIIRKEHSLHLEGKEIEKTGFDTYSIVDGWAITCKVKDGETPPWSFASSKVDIRQGGYAVLKNARFKIKDIPIFYSPYLIVPVKDSRQTGFLFPEFYSSSNGGFGFNVPFFINISESADLTLFPEMYLDRGFMPGAEFRYMTSETSKGAFTASFLDDALSDPSETSYYNATGYTHTNSDRYWLRGKADYNFGDGWHSRLDIDVVSDHDYLQEFDKGSTGFEETYRRYLKTFGRSFQNKYERYRENAFSVAKSWGGIFLEGKMLAINDANKIDDTAANPLWKLPDIKFSGTLPTDYYNISFDWDTGFVYHWQEDGIGGSRFDVKPSLSIPLPISSYLESQAKVSLRDTLYLVETFGSGEWASDKTQNRLYPELQLDFATTLQKNFDFADSSFSTLRHQIRPYVEYNYIPDVGQEDLPQFDSIDTVKEKNAVTYGMDNFFDKLTALAGGSESTSEYATFQLEQSYHFVDPNDTNRPFSDIYSSMLWRPYKRSSLEYKTYYDVYDNEFNNHSFEGILYNKRGDHIGLEYSYNKIKDIDQINGSLGTSLFDNWLLEGEIEHSLSQEETIEAKGSLTYRALCWSVKFQTKYTPADTSFVLLFNLANIGVPLGAQL